MNYFTKAELEAISEELDGTLYKDLRAKVQSMIDNYCEHPENMSMYSLGVEYCVKCKRQINDNK